MTVAVMFVIAVLILRGVPDRSSAARHSIVYALLRAIAGVALRWYYRDIQVEGLERIPRHRPLLLVVNHPNALVDALLVGWVVPRRVLITAKATIFANPIGGAAAALARRRAAAARERRSQARRGRVPRSGAQRGDVSRGARRTGARRSAC